MFVICLNAFRKNSCYLLLAMFGIVGSTGTLEIINIGGIYSMHAVASAHSGRWGSSFFQGSSSCVVG